MLYLSRSVLRAMRPVCAAVATLVAASAVHAASDSQRVIVMFKPGAVGAGKAAGAAARGVVKHEIYGMDAIAIEVPPRRP